MEKLFSYFLMTRREEFNIVVPYLAMAYGEVLKIKSVETIFSSTLKVLGHESLSYLGEKHAQMKTNRPFLPKTICSHFKI